MRIRSRIENTPFDKKSSQELSTTEVKKVTLLASLASTQGNIAFACKIAEVSRMTHYRWLRSDPVYAQKVDDIAEGIVDNVETVFLSTMLKEKDLRSMRWFLERKGKSRGYGKPSVNALVDEDGNPIALAMQNNINVSVRNELPPDSLVTALRDVVQANPALMQQVLGIESSNTARAEVVDGEYEDLDDEDEEDGNE